MDVSRAAKGVEGDSLRKRTVGKSFLTRSYDFSKRGLTQQRTCTTTSSGTTVTNSNREKRRDCSWKARSFEKMTMSTTGAGTRGAAAEVKKGRARETGVGADAVVGGGSGAEAEVGAPPAKAGAAPANCLMRSITLLCADISGGEHRDLVLTGCLCALLWNRNQARSVVRARNNQEISTR